MTKHPGFALWIKASHKWFPRLFTGCLLLTLSGCDYFTASTPSAGESPPAGGPRQVETALVQRKDLEQTIELPGTIEGYETADLYAKVSGYLAEINVDIGDRVRSSQVLARLSVPEMEKELDQKQAAIESARAEVNQSRAGIRQAQARVTSAEALVEEAATMLVEKQSQHRFRKAEFDRTEELVKTGSMLAKRLDETRYQLEAADAAMKSVDASVRTARAELEAARANVVKAETDLASAQARVAVALADAEKTKAMIEYATIRAPFSGIIVKRSVDPGAFIQSAAGNSGVQPLLTVTRTDIVGVMLDLPMKEVRWLDLGDPVVLDRIVVFPDEQFVGQVARYSPSLNLTSRMMRVEIDLENPSNRLFPGLYGMARLRLRELPRTPVIPASALLSDQAGTYVYVVEDNVCRRRDVVTNYEDGSQVGIETGLRGGEQVVVAGGGQLSEGQNVNAVPAASGQ